MKTLIILSLAMIFAASALQNQANACYYGGVDPDVELYCSGDANQARTALARLEKRGMGALNAIDIYTVRAERNHVSYTRHLTKLQTDPSLLPVKESKYFAEMDAETRQREIERAEKFLQWNVKRLEKARFLNQHIRGFGFAGESLQFGKLQIG